MTTNQIGMPSYNYQSLEVWITQVSNKYPPNYVLGVFIYFISIQN